MFDPKQVDLTIRRFLYPGPIEKVLGSLLFWFGPRMRTLLEAGLKLFNSFGRPLRRLIGLGNPECQVVRLKEYLLPLSDGASLATDIYLPEQVFRERSQAPTILIRLPYWKDLTAFFGYNFASRGYVVVMQDVRGTAHSSPHGTPSFFLSERSDGLETLRWISKRFWWNERLGMWGASYFGLTQLAVSWDNKDLVTCLYPSEITYSNPYDHPGGLFTLEFAAALWVIGHTIPFYQVQLRPEVFDDLPDRVSLKMTLHPLGNLYNEPLQPRRSLLHLSELRSLPDLPRRIVLVNERLGLQWDITQRDTGQFYKVMRALTYEKTFLLDTTPFIHGWGFNFQPDCPMLVIAGWYDCFFEGTIRDLEAIQDQSPDYFKMHYKIFIGPWTHGGMAGLGISPQMAFRGVKDTLSFFQNMQHMWWFEDLLKSDGHRIRHVPPINLYMINRNCWRHFNAWPPKTRELQLFIQSNGRANTRFGDGVLITSPPTTDQPPDEYDFNPADPVITHGGRNLIISRGSQNQRNLEERRDVLVYTTEKLKEGLEIIGKVKFVFYAASSAQDTDFMAKLVQVSPNGRKAMKYLESGVRARFREGLAHPEFLESEQIYRYEIDLGHIALFIPKNHRIRLEVSSSNYPKFDINSNLAGEEGPRRYCIAHQRIFHDSEHPSYLSLPIYPTSDKEDS